MKAPNLQGKTILVTGATAGIGRAASFALARMGAHMVLVGRDRQKAESTVAQIKAQTGNGQVEYLLADMSVQAEVRRLAEEVRSRYPRLDVLLNNAGGVFNPRQVTKDGLELTFALNHLGYFLLTNLLLDLLKASAPARIVNVSSEAHRLGGGRINFDDLMGEKSYNPMTAYGQSKLANILFTYELARRLKGTGVTVNCLHPGGVATNFGQSAPGAWAWAFKLFRPFMLTPEQGADTLVYLASAPEVEGVTGKYWVKRRPKRSNAESYDEGVAERLWKVSEQLTGLA